MSAALTLRDQAYMSELAAEIVTHGNPAADLVTELIAAHGRRQAFIAELRDGVTVRAVAARKAIALNFHTNANYRAASSRLMFDVEQVAA